MTNIEIHRAVQAELASEPCLPHAQIGVAVAESVVTLSGAVPSYVDARAAEAAALRVPGVCGVTSELSVELPPESRRSDRELAAIATKVLAATVHVPAGVQLVVEHGHLTLSGEVAWPHEKDAAEQAVSHLVGVRGVHNEIRIKPHTMGRAIAEDFVAALRASSVSDTSHIHVDCREEVLMLSGNVRSCADRDEAVRLAWCVPGVRQVECRLRVAPVRQREAAAV
jgi:osmotically-inducible protein OsmY